MLCISTIGQNLSVPSNVHVQNKSTFWTQGVCKLSINQDMTHGHRNMDNKTKKCDNINWLDKQLPLTFISLTSDNFLACIMITKEFQQDWKNNLLPFVWYQKAERFLWSNLRSEQKMLESCRSESGEKRLNFKQTWKWRKIVYFWAEKRRESWNKVITNCICTTHSLRYLYFTFPKE